MNTARLIQSTHRFWGGKDHQLQLCAQSNKENKQLTPGLAGGTRVRSSPHKLRMIFTFLRGAGSGGEKE